MTKIWTCKIGECNAEDLPTAADGPMREAIVKAYHKITGKDCSFLFSGWGGELTPIERAIADNFPPDEFDRVAKTSLNAHEALMNAVRANHQWHIDYDDAGYAGSDLEKQNIAVLAQGGDEMQQYGTPGEEH